MLAAHTPCNGDDPSVEGFSQELKTEFWSRHGSGEEQGLTGITGGVQEVQILLDKRVTIFQLAKRLN